MHFEALLRDSDTLGAERRICLLQWATALGALPAAGLAADRKIRLKLYEGVGDETLPEVHTCSREVREPSASKAAHTGPSAPDGPRPLPNSDAHFRSPSPLASCTCRPTRALSSSERSYCLRWITSPTASKTSE
jgi:hypothetical protein